MSDLSSTLFTMRLRLARAALLWERAWPACWPAIAVAGTFLVLALFDLLPQLPGFLHAAVLAVLLITFIGAAIHAGRAIAWPDHNAARRRIEQASGLSHRPLAVLDDRPSGTLDAASQGLWEAHRQRMAALARRLRVGWPQAGLARRDPWGVRAVLAMLLLIGGVDAGADWRDRIVAALSPDIGRGTPVAASFDIWVTPPDYTGLPPQFLRAGDGGTIHIPTGSALLAQIHGGDAVPRLAIDGDTRKFDAVDKENFRAVATLTQGTRLSVIQDGSTLGSWPIEIVPDKPPTILFAEPPKPTARAALRLDYAAADDYGVESVKAVIRRRDGNPDEKIEFDLPLPGLHLKAANATSYHDLTAHPWAGLPVEIRLVATDALNQTGTSAPVTMTLPERVFHDPVARAIIAQRKVLVTHADGDTREAVAEILGDLQSRPALYRNDAVVFLALRLAPDRLRHDGSAASNTAVEQLLWDTALRIEDGGMSLAENNLRRLERQLQDALARNAPDPEIDRLMQQLQQALDQYMQQLAQEARRHPETATQPVDPSRVISRQDLQRMLDRARDLARSGDRDQARQMLSQLQNMLENLRTARPGQTQQRGASEAEQMMRGMQDLMRRQQQLLDRSFRAQQQGQRGQPGDRGQMGQPGDRGQMGQPGAPQSEAEMGDAAGQQEALRRSLGDMMRQLGEATGEIPDPFGQAERAMKGAAEALQRGQPGDAIGPQTDALDQLQQAARDFAQQMRQRMGKGSPGDGDDSGTSDGLSRDRSERDPLGRPLATGGTYDQGDVKIPDAGVLQKSREILDELRRRAGERARPELELDYIDRLLKQF